uniref:heparinase II/III family protein n=1 Tax=uncultured Halomonas sp. TaxID=173971 RepID=UPI002636C27C|nr:heparinase II/III family protein [uncultured Halomonas sp.]
MTTQELLACVTPGAIEYIQKAVNSKNKADYQKLKKLFDEQRFEAKSFDDTELDILTFDWQSLDRDRNWWWQLQALPFLNWYANSLALQSDEEKSHYLSLCLDAVHNWVNQAKQNKASPLVWHDHAAAFRVRNLTNWLAFCHSSDLPLGEEPCAELLASLIIEHLDWLQEDKHYSKHTNHGFDQAMIALTIALMFVSDDFETYRLRNRERLKDEVTFAFTDEGVHKENSPGYQKMMLGRLKQLRTLALLGEQEISQMGERYIEKAEAFLRAITLPNGYLPMIGDTRGGDEGLPYQQKEKVDMLDFSASGYVIVRGKMDSGLEFFLLFKNTHESNYHRHDDDLMIFLYVDGEVVLGDGGLGSHQESDPRRKYLRSIFSHSVPILNRAFIRDKGKLQAPPVMRLEKKSCLIKGVSKGFGVKVTRVVDYSEISNGKLVVEDNCDKSLLSSNWFLNNKKAYFNVDDMEVFYPGFSLKIDAPENEPVKLFRGWDGADISSSAIISESYADFLTAQRLAIGSSREKLKVGLAINKVGEG